MFVKTALIKCKIENGKLMSGRQFVMSKNILCPSVTLQPFAQFCRAFIGRPSSNGRKFMMKISCINEIQLPK